MTYITNSKTWKTTKTETNPRRQTTNGKHERRLHIPWALRTRVLSGPTGPTYPDISTQTHTICEVIWTTSLHYSTLFLSLHRGVPPPNYIQLGVFQKDCERWLPVLTTADPQTKTMTHLRNTQACKKRLQAVNRFQTYVLVY